MSIGSRDFMNWDEKENIVAPGELPEKDGKVDAAKGNEIDSDTIGARIVDDKLIGDDRDMQDAIRKTGKDDEEPAPDANY